MSLRRPSRADRSPPVPLGDRLRAARLARGLTLDAVAQAASLSKGFLSRLERDEVSPSVASLVAVCVVLGLRVGELFEPTATAVVRAGRGVAINFGGTDVVESLLTPGWQQQLQVIRSLIAPGGHGGEELYSLLADVEFVYVVAGDVEVRFPDERIGLGPGDALTFAGREPHTWRNLSASVSCEVLWILSPAP